MQESAKYKMLQGFYWMLYCVGFVYVTYFLQEKGITASMIGVVVAVCGVISAFLQTWIGSLADKGNGLNWECEKISVNKTFSKNKSEITEANAPQT